MKKRLAAMLIALLACLSLLPVPPARAAERKMYMVGFNYHLAPFQFLDGNGGCVGLDIDLLNRVAEEYGVDFVFAPFSTDDNCRLALENGAIDIVLGFNGNIPVGQGLEKLNELLQVPLCAVIRKDYAGRANQFRVASLAFRTIQYSYLQRLGASSFVAYGDQDMLYRAIVDGSAPFAVGLQDYMNYHLYNDGLLDKYELRRDIATLDLCLLLRSEDTELRQILQDGLVSLRTSGEYAALYDRWVVDPAAQQRDTSIHRLTMVLLAVLAGSVLTFAFVFFANHSLKRLVRERTADLTQANAMLEARLQQLSSESRLRNSIIQYSPNSMLLFGRDYRVALINSTAEKLLELPAGTALGLDVRELPVVGEAVRRQSLTDLFLHDNQPIPPQDIQLDHPRKKIYRYSLCGLLNEDGSHSVLINIEDVTTEEQRLNDLFEARKNNQLTRLAAGIAHEIKNPLMVLKTASSLMIESRDDPEVFDAFKRFVPGEIDRINALVYSFLNYARPMSDSTEVVSLPELVNECLNLAHIAAKKTTIRFSTSLEELYIETYKNRVRQSIINIMMNGIDAMERKLCERPELDGSMEMGITVRSDGEDAVLLIRDTGTGMSEEQCRRCTEPYFTTKQTGAGLGLAIVARFVKECGGSIEIRSREREYTEVELRFRRKDA